jgi:DNA-binding response OmpR family regulator
MKILVTEDENKMAALLKKGLTEQGHTVILASDGVAAQHEMSLGEFDVILLDVMMPHMDGYQFLTWLRGKKDCTPVLMLTAKDAEDDVAKGLDLGADDYLTKPFSFKVLLARLRALGRRGTASHSNQIVVADLILDLNARTASRGGHSILLSPTEFRLLEFMMRRPGRALMRQAIFDAVWGYDQEIEDNTLDAFVRLLRNKIDTPFPRKLIYTIRGVGYILRPE